jgi:dihydrolipoamide dehydrogenase
MAGSYDVAIIGAGTAGLSARAEVARKTDNYVVIDGGILGTTCARVGCMPSKSLVEVANAYHRQSLFRMFGISDSVTAPPDIANVMGHVRRLRDRFVSGVEKGMDSWKEHLIRKNARFIDANTLDLGDETIRAGRIVIATGSKPVVPEKWRKYERYLVDADEFFGLESVPPRMAVFGLGPNGIELGQALARLGIDVTAITLDKTIGGLTDPDIQQYALQTLSGKMKVRIGSAEILDDSDHGLTVGCNGCNGCNGCDDESWMVDQVLLTMGRHPAIDDLGLENLGVELDNRGMPRFDEATLQIENLPVFIAGDTTGSRALLHEAADEGRIAGYNAVAGGSDCFQKRIYMGIVFSDPDIAIIGRSYASLAENGVEFIIGESDYEYQGRAVMTGRNQGLVHVYADKGKGLILGAELIAPEGEHLAHLISWIVACNLSARDVLSLPFYHPTLEEGLRKAFRQVVKKSTAPKPQSEIFRCGEAIAI